MPRVRCIVVLNFDKSSLRYGTRSRYIQLDLSGQGDGYYCSTRVCSLSSVPKLGLELSPPTERSGHVTITRLLYGRLVRLVLPVKPCRPPTPADTVRFSSNSELAVNQYTAPAPNERRQLIDRIHRYTYAVQIFIIHVPVYATGMTD